MSYNSSINPYGLNLNSSLYGTSSDPLALEEASLLGSGGIQGVSSTQGNTAELDSLLSLPGITGSGSNSLLGLGSGSLQDSLYGGGGSQLSSDLNAYSDTMNQLAQMDDADDADDDDDDDGISLV
jgi:hypothetical protein